MTRTLENVQDAPAAKKRPVWKPLAAAGIGGAVLVATGFGVFAQLSATAFNGTAQAVDSGTLRLNLTASATSVGFDQAIEKVAPGDVVNRLVTVTNTGTLAGKDLTLAIADGTPSLLSTDAQRGLFVTVTRCEGTWSYPATPGAAPLCSAGAAGTAVAVSDRAISTMGTAVPVAAANLSPSGVNNFLVSLRLPDSTEVSVNNQPAIVAGGSIQGLSAKLTYTFSELQRTATTTNS